jgi:molybdopterin synthase catalytic subunit
MIALAAEPIDPAALLAAFTRDAGGAGAIVSFSGIVRPDGGVTGLWLDHHDGLTLAAIEVLAGDARDRFGLADLAIVHRVGSLVPGDPIVFAAAAASHRRAAFEAVDFVMDRLKTAVPLWKCETRGDSRTWIEACGQDHADAARWEVK